MHNISDRAFRFCIPFIMFIQVLREVVSNVKSSEFYTLMVDETPDVANKEQVVICLRWVDNDFEVHEEFIGLYTTATTTADELVRIIKDALLRMNLSLSKVRGQCYDGAASMSGGHRGVATQLMKEEPRALYTHCYGHALNLACSDTIKNISLMRDALDNTKEITKLIKNSPKRGKQFENLKANLADAAPIGLRTLCPTRWTVKADALESIIQNYETLQNVFKECLNEEKDPHTRGRLRGVVSYMKSFNYFFGVKLGHHLLSHSDNLSRTLQRSDISAAEGQSLATKTVKTLANERDKFDSFWCTVVSAAEKVGVIEPEEKRQKKVPARFDSGLAQDTPPDTIKEHYRRIYLEAVDNIVSCIGDRFEQEGYKTYAKLQQLLLKSCNNEEVDEELLKFVCNFYGDDFKKGDLRSHLQTIKATFKNDNSKKTDCTLPMFVDYMRGLSPSERNHISQVCILVKLILVMPATNAVSERSFSAMKRIKSYLRSTMTQQRLNHLMLLHIHKDHTDRLNLIEAANDFVYAKEHRRSIFGIFKACDLSLP